MENLLPHTATEYITCFRQLAAIAHHAMDSAQQTHWVSDNDRNKGLTRLAEIVETIACLRGDSGLFGTSRPQGLAEYQKEMYATEEELRNRLLKLGYQYPSR